MESKKVKVYAFYIKNDELYNKCTLNKGSEAEKCLLEHTTYAYFDPKNFLNHFLYLTEEERDKAFEIIKKHFETAEKIPFVGFVDQEYLEVGRR